MNIDSEGQRKKSYTQRFRKSCGFNQETTGVIKKLKIEKPIRTITKKRLTMKIGMFQLGKRSERFTTKISEENKARANEDLKRILQLANPTPSSSSKEANRIIPNLDAIQSQSGWNSILNRTKRKKNSTRSLFKSTDLESLEEKIEFPKSPPIERVVDRLSSVVETKLKDLYVDRDPLEESRCELRKILTENEGGPLFLGPIQKIMSHEPEEETERDENDIRFELISNFSSAQESMRGLKFLRLGEEASQEEEHSFEEQQRNRKNWEEDSSCKDEMSHQTAGTRGSSQRECVCWKSQILEEEQEHCPPLQSNLRLPSLNTCLAGQKQMDFMDYLDKFNIRRRESSFESTAHKSWRSSMPTTYVPMRLSVPRSPSPPIFKFYRHKLY